MADKYHPDKLGQLPKEEQGEGNRMMRLINKAKEVLGNPLERYNYDLELEKDRTQDQQQHNSTTTNNGGATQYTSNPNPYRHYQTRQDPSSVGKQEYSQDHNEQHNARAHEQYDHYNNRQYTQSPYDRQTDPRYSMYHRYRINNPDPDLTLARPTYVTKPQTSRQVGSGASQDQFTDVEQGFQIARYRVDRLRAYGYDVSRYEQLIYQAERCMENQDRYNAILFLRQCIKEVLSIELGSGDRY